MAKMNIYDLARALKERGLKAETFNNGIHWRIKPINIDLWPTKGHWKWMTEHYRGTVEEFGKFLDELKDKEAVLADVIVRKS